MTKNDKQLRAMVSHATGQLLIELKIAKPSERTREYLRKVEKKLAAYLDVELGKIRKREARMEEKKAKMAKKAKGGAQ